MLESLLNTKLKKAILGILFGQPKRSFSVDELRYLTKGPRRQTMEVVREFVRVELLETASAKKGRRLYRLNAYFPLFNELRDLVSPGRRQKPDDQITRKLRQIVNIRLAALSGIFTFQPHLPVDMLLVGDGVSGTKLSRVLSEIEEMVGQEVNYTLLSQAEYDSRRFMSDRLIRDVLDNPHLVVFNYLRDK